MTDVDKLKKYVEDIKTQAAGNTCQYCKHASMCANWGICSKFPVVKIYRPDAVACKYFLSR